jgi:excisionase family DNA binding protein
VTAKKACKSSRDLNGDASNPLQVVELIKASSSLSCTTEGVVRAGNIEHDRPLTATEVAELFRCSSEKVKRQARAGKLPGFKFGKFWYFRRPDIDRIISQAVQSGSAIGAASEEE